jgi:PAS domain S-box-containing protein
MSGGTAWLSSREGDLGWETLFWLVFRRSSDPMWLLDEQARVLDVNAAMIELRGQTREEIVRAVRFDTMPPAERAGAMRDWQAVLRTGEGSGKRVLVRPETGDLEYEWAARSGRIGGRRFVVAVMTRVDAVPRSGGGDREAGALTPREREVVTLIALGHDTREIAASLYVSPYTVRAHVRNSMSKLGASTRAQLAATALSGGLITAVPDGPSSS